MRITSHHPFYAWLAIELRSRDTSHGLAHALRVRDTALRTPLPPLSRKDLNSAFLLELAALTHDVADHKYVTSMEHQLGQRSRLQEALQMQGGASAHEAALVILIGQNISFKRECLQTLPLGELQDHGVLPLHQRVSDADKLDALGILGLQRLWHYNLHCGHCADDRVLYAALVFDNRRLLQRLYRQHAAPRCDAMREFREEGRQRNETALMLMEDVDVDFHDSINGTMGTGARGHEQCRFLCACLPELHKDPL